MRYEYRYVISCRDFVFAIRRLAEWQGRAVEAEEKDSYAVLIAASDYGGLYVGASLWHQSAIMLLPLPVNKKKSKLPECSLVRELHADRMMRLVSELEATDGELRIVYDDDLKEVRFYWRKSKRVLPSDHFGNLLAPFMYSWCQTEAAFTASVQREPWLQMLQNVLPGNDHRTVYHKWEIRGATAGVCEIEKYTISFQALSTQLSLLLPTRPLVAFLEMVETPSVVLRAHRLYGCDKSYTVRLLTPHAEFFAYCPGFDPIL